MKLINKILTRLLWGGFDLRVGLGSFFPIPKVHLYIWPLIFVFGYQWVIHEKYPYEAGLFTEICLGLFIFIMYVIFIHWKIYPVKFEDMTDYQKWLYGKGLKFNNSGLNNTLTEEQWKEWEDIVNNKLVV